MEPSSTYEASGKGGKPEGPPVRVAAFDFDGTLTSCQSGLHLALYLWRRGHVSPARAAALAWWGIRYKLHLPYREDEARELVLGAVSESAAEVVDRLMVACHDEELAPRYRSDALAELRRRQQEGCACVLVSATFQGIAERAVACLGMDAALATQVAVGPDGHYTGKVVGEVVQGPRKLEAVRAWADGRYGADGWTLAYAYGDHRSDAALLAAAAHPGAVCPGQGLRSIAEREGWPVLDWDAGGDVGPEGAAGLVDHAEVRASADGQGRDDSGRTDGSAPLSAIRAGLLARHGVASRIGGTRG